MRVPDCTLGRTAPAHVAAACSVLLASTWPGTAAEYCVSCSGPDATYRCAVEGAPAEGGIDPRAQLACITELARSGGHDSCAVSRATAEHCPGALRIVAAPSSPSIAPSETPAEGEPVPVEPALPAEAVEVPAQGPVEDGEQQGKTPETIEELAGATVKSSQEGLKKAGDAVAGTAKSTGEQIGKAGSAVGTAAKKTWNCLTSLFKDC